MTKHSSLAATAAAALLAAGAAQAQNVVITSDGAEQARANLEASMKAAARGQKVGMVTGRANPQPQVLADGTVALELDASTMVQMIARRRADGSIEMVCVDSPQAAAKALKAPASFAKPYTAARETTNEK